MTIYTMVKVIESFNELGYMTDVTCYGLGSFKSFKDAVNVAEDLGFELGEDQESFYTISDNVNAKNWTSVRYEIDDIDEYVLITATEMDD